MLGEDLAPDPYEISRIRRAAVRCNVASRRAAQRRIFGARPIIGRRLFRNLNVRDALIAVDLKGRAKRPSYAPATRVSTVTGRGDHLHYRLITPPEAGQPALGRGVLPP